MGGKVKRPADRTIKSFFKAIREGAKEKVAKALASSMPPSIRFAPYGDETTPLCHALWSRENEVAMMLLDAGADPTDATADGTTPLHHVEDAAVCARLLELDVPLEPRDRWGRTAIHHAASANAVEVVRLLLAAGADALSKDKEGRGPVDGATNVAIRDMLYAAGAKRPPNPGGVVHKVSSKSITLGEIDPNRGALGLGGDGAVWVGSYSGIYRVDGDSAERFTMSEDGGTPAVGDIHGSPDGSTYIRTNWGLFRVKDDKVTVYNHDNSPLHDQHITETGIDSKGRVYCASYESESKSKHLSVFDGESWTLLRPDGDALPEEMELKCIRFDADDNLLLGTSKGIFAKKDGAWHLDSIDDGVFKPSIYDIAFAGGAEWIACQRGVYRRTATDLKKIEIEHLPKVMCADGDALWVGSGYGGIYKLDIATGETLLHLTEEGTGFNMGGLENIVRSPDGRIWVHINRALYRIADDKLVALSDPEPEVDWNAERELEPLPEKPFLDATQIPADFASAVESTALEGISATALLGLVRPAIGFDVKDGVPAVGATKFGGTPDLPSDIEWPLYEDDDDAMPFLLQINFAELAELDIEGLLPKSGMLYVFTDTQPDDLYAYKLITTDAQPGQLTRQSLPESLALRRDVDDFVAEFPEHALSLSSQLTLPSHEFIEARCKLTDADSDAISELRDKLGAGAHSSQFLGWPDCVQGEFLSDEDDIVLVQLSGWELSANGIHKYFEHWCGDGVLHWVARREDIANGNYDEAFGNMAYT